MAKEKARQHSIEFRADIARRMIAGENISKLSDQYKLARSMMYRWRDAYRKLGPAGVSRYVGRPAGQNPGGAEAAGKKIEAKNTEERLRIRIAELERLLGQQTAEIDLFKGVFKRLEDLPKANRHGGRASTRRSAE